MSGYALLLSNKQARTLWLNRQGMAAAPCGSRQDSALIQCVNKLGMVQLDSINILARAQHHILWSRQSAYRPARYDHLLQGERAVFEHFSHDAVILPMSTFPFWRRQMQRCAERYSSGMWGNRMMDTALQKTLLEHIEKYGPVCSRDLAHLQRGPVDRSQHAWMRPDHKLVLEYLWFAGRLSVSHRRNFNKYYDLTERIIPAQFRNTLLDENVQIDWLCEQALSRLGFASASEIQRFWGACDLQEVKAWLLQPSIPVMNIEYVDAIGQRNRAYAPVDLEKWLEDSLNGTSRVRIVNPFDPVVRDRRRLKKLFGFDFRIEIYVPAAKRRFGYYVFPMLEGSRMIGRIEVRANRESDELRVQAWWLEPGVPDTPARREKISRELQRLTRLANVSSVSPLPEPSTHAYS